MSNSENDMEKAFLSHFLTEGIYYIPNEHQSEKKSAPLAESVKLPESIFESVIESNGLEEIREEILSLPSVGEFRKKVLILVNAADSEFYTDQEKELLFKILGAVGLSISDVAIVNIHLLVQFPKDLFDAIKKWPYEQLIAFCGFLPALDIIVKAPMFKLTKAQSKMHLISSPISELIDDVEKKKLLWKELQLLMST
jgi:hypothetical protein